jgi:hypothetical protein
MGNPLAGDHTRLILFRGLRAASFDILSRRQPFLLFIGEGLRR